MKKYMLAGLIALSFAGIFAFGVKYAIDSNRSVAIAAQGAEVKATGVVESVDMSKGVLVLKKTRTGDRLAVAVEEGDLKGLKAGDKVVVQYRAGEENVAFYLRKMSPKLDTGC